MLCPGRERRTPVPSPEKIPRQVHPKVGRAKALLAVRTRDGAPPQAIEAASAELRDANAEAAVQRVVDSWPPLSAETRARLACLLLLGGDDGAA
jgi:hypothetical protein